MSFTNEDLKRLKEEHQNHDYNVRVECDICDLLFRLEASEALCRVYEAADKRGIGWMAVADHRLVTWRRSKGE